MKLSNVPEGHKKSEAFFRDNEKGLGKAKLFQNRFIILDRDGTIVIDEKGYTHKIEDLKFFPDAFKALNLLKDSFRFIIITNQSGIGRGYYTEQDFHKFNSHIVKELEKKGIKIEKTYFCPHTPEENCDCRKPKTKFIKEAEKEFNINLKESFVIGDHPCDIKLGKKAGCKTIYLLTGHGKKHKTELNAKPDFTANNLLEAAQWIIR